MLALTGQAEGNHRLKIFGDHVNTAATITTSQLVVDQWHA